MAGYDATELPKYRVDMVAEPDPDVPEERWIALDGGDLPCRVEVRLGRQQSGRLICTGLRFGAPDGGEEHEVTKSMLRVFPWANVMTFIRDAVAGVAEWDWLNLRFGDWPTAGEAMGATVKSLTVRRGRRGLDDDELRQTAEVYRQAVAQGYARPREVAAARLEVDQSTVWRRLQKAWERFPEMKPKSGGTP